GVVPGGGRGRRHPVGRHDLRPGHDPGVAALAADAVDGQRPDVARPDHVAGRERAGHRRVTGPARGQPDPGRAACRPPAPADPANIGSVSLIRAGAVTHSIDMDQRYVPRTFTQTAGGLSVQAPANGNLAPPGYYMLFIVDANGVPSVAPLVRLPAGYEDAQPP